MNELIIKSSAFCDGEYIDKKYTGFGEDMSPDFEIENLCDECKSIAIILNDLDIPFVKEYPHWLIWNIPVCVKIPQGKANGGCVIEGAVEGVAFGKNRYRGPKQPVFIRNTHRYRFDFYALDTFLDISKSSDKSTLLKAMNGDILQKGSIMFRYKR